MRSFIKFVENLSAIAGGVASILIAVAILIVCQMVFIRYVLVGSAAWQTEVVTFSLVGATLLGSAWVLKERGHVAVNILTETTPPAIQRKMLFFSDMVVAVFALIMFWKGTQMTWEAWEGSWTTESIYEFPLWIPFIFMPLGFGLLALQALASALKPFAGIEEKAQTGGH